MLKRLLLSNSPFYFIVLPILSLIIPVFFHSYFSFHFHLNHSLIKIPILANPDYTNIISIVVFGTFSVLSSLFVPMLVSRFGLFEKGNFFTPIIWIPLSQLFVILNGDLSPFVFASYNLLIIYFLFGLYKSTYPAHLIFNASLIAGIGSLFSILNFSVFIIIISGWFFFQPFRMRALLVSIVGFILPFFFTFSIYFLLDKGIDFWNIFTLPFVSVNEKISYVWMFFTSFLLFFLLAGLLRLIVHGYVKKISLRRNFALLVFIYTFYLTLSFVRYDFGFFAYLLFPVSVLTTLFFVNINKKAIFNLMLIVFILGWTFILLSFIRRGHLSI